MCEMVWHLCFESGSVFSVSSIRPLHWILSLHWKHWATSLVKDLVGNTLKLAACSQVRQKSPKTPPPPKESSLTTHVTEINFLHVLDLHEHLIMQYNHHFFIIDYVILPV